MENEYGRNYVRVFRAAFDAGAAAAVNLSDSELEELTRYSGIVGLIAETTLFSRKLRHEKTG